MHNIETGKELYNYNNYIFPKNGVISSKLTLREYQIDCVYKYFSEYKTYNNTLPYHSRIIAADPGLGKTYIALSIAKVYSLAFDWPIYVVVPPSTIEHWIRHTKEFNLINKIVFQSWGSIKNHSLLCRFILIVDECHFAQDFKTKRSRAVMTLSGNPWCMATIQLSATPIKNGHPKNLFPLLRMARHPIANDRENYYIFYCGATYQTFVNKRGQNVKTLKPGKTFQNQDKLKEIVTPLFQVYKRKDCLKGLPPKTRILYNVSLDKNKEKEYITKCEELYNKWFINPAMAETMVLGLLQQMRAYNSMLKSEVSLELIFNILDSGHALIIFTCFVKSAEFLNSQVSKKYNCGIITGSVNVSDRQLIIDNFQSGKLDCLVLTIGSCGVGINADRASYEILIDRDYTAAGTIQAEDRGYRMTTTHEVTVYWIAHGRIDQIIDRYNHDKIEYSSDILDVDDDISYSDIMKLYGSEYDVDAIDIDYTEVNY